MSIKKCLRLSLPIVALFAFASMAAAQGTTVTAPTLEMTANVVTAMKLTISTDTVNLGATVTSSVANEFSVDLGDVNGLGVGLPAAGVSVTSNSTGAVYTTPVNLTPTFSGFTAGEEATIRRAPGTSGNEDIAFEGDSATNLSALAGATTTVISNVADGSLNTRYVGFEISHAETTGTKTATVIYSIVVD